MAAIHEEQLNKMWKSGVNKKWKHSSMIQDSYLGPSLHIYVFYTRLNV